MELRADSLKRKRRLTAFNQTHKEKKREDPKSLILDKLLWHVLTGRQDS